MFRKLIAAAAAGMLLFSSTASAAMTAFNDLGVLQRYIYNHSLADMEGLSIYVILTGTVQEIRQTTGNHWEMMITVDDEDGYSSLLYSDPAFVAHFRLHVDPCPFAVGDTLEIYGTLNPMYTSFLYPYVLAETINGSDEY